MSEWTNSVLTGDVRERLDDLPDDSVHMAMTSPPYFGLRDYGHDDQIGLEDELDAYIEELVAVFRDLRRVLRPDGSAWLNLGDSYAGSGGAGGDFQTNSNSVKPNPTPKGKTASELNGGVRNGSLKGSTLGRKNKMLVPHRVAIALQSDGWVVRNDVTWVKPNPMPQSVKDRLNTTTEQIFHLTPNPDYWYDLDAIREPHATAEHHERYHGNGQDRPKQDAVREEQPVQHELGQENTGCHPAGKNPGDVFEVTTKPFPDAHFAVYPPELCEKPLKATCPPKVCAECGSPYERETRDESGFTDGVCNACGRSKSKHKQGTKNAESGSAMAGDVRICSNKITEGWTPTCDCDTDATEPGIALDPFAGAGTTLLKAKELGRRFVGVELNAEYADMARARIGLTPNDPATVRSDDAQQGFEAYTDGGDSA